MQSLANQRPIFHSKADCQHALAWEIRRRLPGAQMRLELPFAVDGRRLHLDIWVAYQGSAVATKLKYPTLKLTTAPNGDRVDPARRLKPSACMMDANSPGDWLGAVGQVMGPSWKERRRTTSEDGRHCAGKNSRT